MKVEFEQIGLVAPQSVICGALKTAKAGELVPLVFGYFATEMALLIPEGETYHRYFRREVTLKYHWAKRSIDVGIQMALGLDASAKLSPWEMLDESGWYQLTLQYGEPSKPLIFEEDKEVASVTQTVSATPIRQIIPANVPLPKPALVTKPLDLQPQPRDWSVPILGAACMALAIVLFIAMTGLRPW